jgi:hypothetical protein
LVINTMKWKLKLVLEKRSFKTAEYRLML